MTSSSSPAAVPKPSTGVLRARGWGIPLEGTPGPQNAITDVPGVEVGHVTLIQDGERKSGRGTIRTGVTAILPRGRDPAPCFAGWFSLNGNGELTGTAWIDESGLLDGPILSTNTYSVGVVRDAVVAWAVDHGLPENRWTLPVVGETWDGYLNDISGFHVTHDHALAAIEGAHAGPVSEGSVGGGTGMICYEFKGGIGTSSRRVSVDGDWSVGVLVQANHGSREELTVAGVPVGRELPAERVPPQPSSSILMFVATDAPLLPHQLKRLARRCAIGLARTGSTSHSSSGDLFLGFSTANRPEPEGGRTGRARLEYLPDPSLDPLFEAVVQSSEEAILNALAAGTTMVGYRGHTVEGFPTARLPDILRRFGRLSPPHGSR
jgi:D-aminopeptidase